MLTIKNYNTYKNTKEYRTSISYRGQLRKYRFKNNKYNNTMYIKPAGIVSKNRTHIHGIRRRNTKNTSIQFKRAYRNGYMMRLECGWTKY